MRTKLGFLAVAIVAGCGPVSDETARQRALEVLPSGTVQSMHADGDDKVVVVAMTTGGIIELELESDGSLEGLESEKGPFDYDIAVPKALGFVAARDKAVAAQPGDLESWRYGSETGWWEFWLRAADTKLMHVKLKAIDGAVISIEPQA